MDSILFVKAISALLYPVGLVIGLAALSWVINGLGGKKTASFLLFVSLSIFLLTSNPIFSRWLLESLERQHPQQNLDQITPHDAILVLGGGLRIPLPPARHIQLASGSDRYWHAARLYRSGKAPKIVLSGGNVFTQRGFRGEAYYASQLLQSWGVPRAAIAIEDQSRTTAENQRNTSAYLNEKGVERVLLVTSGYHMPRALKAFAREAFSITPASADVLIRNQSSPLILDFIPSAGALNLSTLALHEYYGIWFMRATQAIQRVNYQALNPG